MKKVLIFCLMIFGMLFPNICAYADYEPIAPSVNDALNSIGPKDENNCPDGGTIGKDGKTCCQNGWALDKETGKYGIWKAVPYVCPCPDGGLYFKKYDGTGICCKDGKVYNIAKDKGYTTYDYPDCQGCPAGGTPSKKDPSVCCHKYVPGVVYSFDKGDYVIDTEGFCQGDCPDGGTYNVVDNGNGTYSGGCCKDGYMYESLVKKYIRVSASVCGCPDGTEKKGKHCCNEHNYELETLTIYSSNPNTLELSFFGCGCPDGGTLNPDCITKGVDCFCCKEGFVFDEVDKKYDDIIPDMCGCPAGGERIDLPLGTYFEGYRGSVCCKNGKAFSEKSGDYTAVYAYCGCPDGGEQSKGEEALGTCCKNNYAFNDLTQKYDKFFLHACGCPNGGEEKVFENAVTTIRGCCKDGFKHSEIKDEYSVVDPVICGCPDGGTPNKPVTMTDERTVDFPTQCCKDGKAWNVLEKKWGHDKTGSCNPPCKDGFAYNPETGDYTDILPSECGCPNGGHPNVEKTATTRPYQCCKDGKYWDRIKGEYTKIDYTICPQNCPVGSVYCDEQTGLCES